MKGRKFGSFAHHHCTGKGGFCGSMLMFASILAIGTSAGGATSFLIITSLFELSQAANSDIIAHNAHSLNSFFIKFPLDLQKSRPLKA